MRCLSSSQVPLPDLQAQKRWQAPLKEKHYQLQCECCSFQLSHINNLNYEIVDQQTKLHQFETVKYSKATYEVAKAEGSEYERNKQKYKFVKKEKDPDE